MTATSCHRCHEGLAWVNDQGTVVAWDALDAEVAFRCDHTGKMRRIRRAWERWSTDSRIRDGGDAATFEARR